ncbi:YicC/YloC family endoribonuclease [Bradyrhizobium sp. WD16]|uniref:YicC/YloC family endoribonuclease n=1 Tax=Bradyrhizobium sp. WD16 TaxID=1521768 RepID=UPI0020A3A2D4|nr:YicC/YloC family endoribonuclease [Bradyrhizobium sp. WD16]UTD29431.1 YicC family protein [Bradyrhizobium sp. WD16]
MALSSMTGFARSHGGSGAHAFEWELKSVNAKGFDFRLRLPPGFDEIEQVLRKRAAERLIRGTVYANLTVTRSGPTGDVRVNEDVLTAMLRIATDLAKRTGAAPPTVDGLLALKGVIEIVEPEASEAESEAARAAVVAAFDTALSSLVEMRKNEGATLGAVLGQRLDEIEAMARQADAAPGRRPEAVRARLAEQIQVLIETSERFDADRLSQEAVMIAARADIREELDRIASHVAQAREMLAKGGAVGRRLDFLAQEFNREVNTTCSKSNDIELTRIGLAMKNVVEQFREQVQNLE